MNLTAQTTQQLSTGAVTLTLFSTLMGGHLTAGYFLFTPGIMALEVSMKVVLGIVALNMAYFLIFLCCMFADIPNKPLLIKAALFMFVNIPIALLYLFVVLGAGL